MTDHDLLIRVDKRSESNALAIARIETRLDALGEEIEHVSATGERILVELALAKEALARDEGRREHSTLSRIEPRQVSDTVRIAQSAIVAFGIIVVTIAILISLRESPEQYDGPAPWETGGAMAAPLAVEPKPPETHALPRFDSPEEKAEAAQAAAEALMLMLTEARDVLPE